MVHVGVLQTALELLDSGYEPLVVVDACTAMNQKDKDTAFDRLASAGVDLTTVEMLGMEWLLSSNAPETASVLAQLYPV
jgi:nicotinamidase-related amidase